MVSAYSIPHNPLDTIEFLADENEWLAERFADDEISLVVKGGWSDILVSVNWRQDLEGLYIVCSFDGRVPSPRQHEVRLLVSLLNQQLLHGHFDLWGEDGTLLFRNALLLAGGARTTKAQCEAFMSTALRACERYFQAFQFVIWAGKTAEEALLTSLLTPVGEA